MTETPLPKPRAALIAELQDQLSALPVPPGVPAPKIERLLEFLGDRADADDASAAVVDAALMSVIDGFAALDAEDPESGAETA